MKRRWTDNEMEIVRRDYPNLNPREIAAALGRSLKAVQQMAAQLGVAKVVFMPTNAVTPIAERFWNKVHKTESCWLWTAYCDPNGYGRLGVGTGADKTMKLATHVAWYLETGSWPEAGAEMCHTCDTPACVRIHSDHLYKGTKSTNMRDVWQRNRAAMEQNLAKGWSR